MNGTSARLNGEKREGDRDNVRVWRRQNKLFVYHAFWCALMIWQTGMLNSLALSKKHSIVQRYTQSFFDLGTHTHRKKKLHVMYKYIIYGTHILSKTQCALLNKTTDSALTHNLQHTQFTLHTFAGIKGLILLIPSNEITVCVRACERESKIIHPYSTRAHTQFKYDEKNDPTHFFRSQFSVCLSCDRCSSSSSIIIINNSNH